ncbi:MAG TPA: hypothetical protein VFM63_06280, partial [Pyrinomonadaceae bacterium]|nr:hypothetical protein [Pyrinomonadaceae bacterium]
TREINPTGASKRGLGAVRAPIFMLASHDQKTLTSRLNPFRSSGDSHMIKKKLTSRLNPFRPSGESHMIKKKLTSHLNPSAFPLLE